jgi:hypothetical protein
MIILAVDRSKDENKDVLLGVNVNICGLRFSIGVCKPWRKEQITYATNYIANVTPFRGGVYFNILAGCVRTVTQWD